MKKILLIEDDQDQVNMYQFAFKLAGFDFISSRTAGIGLSAAKAEKPDLILLDILLDHDSGLDVLKKLKADQETQNIPVIIVTNFSKEEVIDKALKLGAVETVIKTDITPKELADKVKKYIFRPAM